MASQGELTAHFRSITGISTVHASDAWVLSMTPACLARHDPTKALSDIGSSGAELTALAYRLAEKYHLMRAGLASEGYPMSLGGEGYSDKSISVRRHLDVAAYYRAEYEALSAALGLAINSISVSSLMRRSREFDITVPANFALPLAAPILTATAGDTIVLLQWTRIISPDFLAYHIYYSDAEGLADPASVTRPGSTYRGIVSTATYETTLTASEKNIWEVAGLTNDTPYYFVVVAQSRNDLVTLSNEISATPTA